jgi:hypothetical protein
MGQTWCQSIDLSVTMGRQESFQIFIQTPYFYLHQITERKIVKLGIGMLLKIPYTEIPITLVATFDMSGYSTYSSSWNAAKLCSDMPTERIQLVMPQSYIMYYCSSSLMSPITYTDHAHIPVYRGHAWRERA